MTPDEARDLFSDAIEGTLDAERQRALDALLAEDDELREEYQAFRSVIESTAAFGGRTADEDPPPNLLRGVQSRLRQRSKGRFYRDRFSEGAGPRGTFPMVLALVVAVLIAAAWVGLSSYVVVDEGRAPSGER